MKLYVKRIKSQYIFSFNIVSNTILILDTKIVQTHRLKKKKTPEKFDHAAHPEGALVVPLMQLTQLP